MTARPNTSSTVSAQPIAASLAQTANAFTANHTVMDAISAEAAASDPTPFDPVRDDANESDTNIDLHNGSYVQLAISLLYTCAEDLVKANKVLARQEPIHGRTRNTAIRLREAITRWLRSEPPLVEIERPLLTYLDCVRLLESELALQSLGQIEVPSIVSQADELAEWIIGSPDEAKYLLGNYLSIFAPHENDFDDDYDLIDTDAGSARSYERPRG